MRKLFCYTLFVFRSFFHKFLVALAFCIFSTDAFANSYTEEASTMAPSIVPQAVLSRQKPSAMFIAGTNFFYYGCDSCDINGDFLDRSTGESDPQIRNSQTRIDGSVFNHTWGSATNFWNGGFFLNLHYTFDMEIGASPMLVQWVGPVYLGATYEWSAGKYKNNNAESVSLNTGAFNIGAGTMQFFDFLKFGIGMHGGVRDIHIMDAEDEMNPYSHHKREEFHIHDCLWYYGFDFAYLHIPRIFQSPNSSAIIASVEIASQIKRTPLSYWALSISFIP